MDGYLKIKTRIDNKEVDKDISEFKQGQEILAYYDGIIDSIFPGSFTADKVKIIKEKSDIEIPIYALRYYNYSEDNISIKVEEFTNTGIEISITDSNKYPIDYGEEFSYCIRKKNFANEAYNNLLTKEFKETINRNVIETEGGTVISPSGENPNKDKYKDVWEELEIIGDEDYKKQSWEKSEGDVFRLKGKCNWSGIYGELEEEGEYNFVLYRLDSGDDTFFSAIVISFIVDQDGEITYDKPDFEW